MPPSEAMSASPRVQSRCAQVVKFSHLRHYYLAPGDLDAGVEQVLEQGRRLGVAGCRPAGCGAGRGGLRASCSEHRRNWRRRDD